MGELTHDQLRRVLIVCEFDSCDSLFWRREGSTGTEGALQVFATCSDFFDWGSADLEPIETEEDVLLLEQSRRDLTAATSDNFPQWITELYAARRRNKPPAPFMISGKYALDAEVASLFPESDNQE